MNSKDPSNQNPSQKSQNPKKGGKKAPPPLALGQDAVSRKDLMLGKHKKKKRVKAEVEAQPKPKAPAPVPVDSAEPGEFPDLPPQQAEAAPKGSRGSSDLGQTIRDRSRTMKSTDLAKNHSEVRVLNLSTVRTLVDEAVKEALQSAEHSWDEEQRQKLLEEAEETFKERLDSFKAEKKGLEAQTQMLQDQLDRAQSVLEDEKHKVVSADQFTVSDQGILELERRLSRLIDKAVQKSSVGQEIERDMREVVSKLLDDEREKIRQHAEDAQNDKIKLLERKVNRLSQSLDDTEQARKHAEHRAHALENAQGGLGLKNIVEAGMNHDDPDKEKKLELLKEIIEGNKDVRSFMKKTGKGKKSKVKKTSSQPQDSSHSAEDSPTDPPTEELQMEANQLEAQCSSEDSVEAQCSEELTSNESSDGSDTVRIDEVGDVEAEGDVEGVQEQIQVSEVDGVKSISVNRIKPPPMKKKKSSKKKDSSELDDATLEFMKSLDGSQGEDSVEVDPDDLVWEPGS